MERFIMDEALADLIRISNATGKDSTLVQGGGGNTSVKTADGKYMYIKASGTALKDMNEKEGWRRIRLDAVLSVIRDKELAKLDASTREPEVVDRLLLACEDYVETGARPSVESHLHAFLDKCVIHLHPIAVGAYVNAKNGKAELEKLFKDEKLPLLWVPYTDPGFMLAKKIANLVDNYQKQYGNKPAVMILEKHGLFITAGTAEAALRLVRKVIKLCSSKLKEPKVRKTSPPANRDITAAKSAIHKAVFDTTGLDLPVSYFSMTDPVAVFMARKDAEKLLATPALNPDELVYANGSAMWVEKCDVNTITEKLNSLVKAGQKPAAAFLVKGLGLFAAAETKMAPVIAEITEGSLRIRMWATKFGGILALTEREQDFINNWEAEAFRKKLASGQTG
jgi:rhamnose utilization protein RhaD (predicted bifunctional aldolase and dehydrogenase)